MKIRVPTLCKPLAPLSGLIAGLGLILYLLAPQPASALSVALTVNTVTVTCPPTMVGFSSVCAGTIGLDMANVNGGVGVANCINAGDCPEIIVYNIVFSDPEFTIDQAINPPEPGPNVPTVICPVTPITADTGGTECNINVLFTPTSAGAKSATMSYVTNAAKTTVIGPTYPSYAVSSHLGGTAVVPITGTALPLNCLETRTATCQRSDGATVAGSFCGTPPVESLSCSSCAPNQQAVAGITVPATLSLSTSSVSCSAYWGLSGGCTTQTVTAVGGYVFLGATPISSTDAHFTYASSSCGPYTYLAPGKSCTIALTYTPAAIGTESGTISVLSTAATVSYTATGVSTANPAPPQKGNH